MLSAETNKFSNKEIAHLLRSIAAVYLLTGEIRFKTIAYEKAADAVEHLTRELKDIWQDNGLYKVPGIGPSIGSHLDEYFKTGHSKHFDSVLGKVPSSVFVLMKIPSVGPKKAFKLVKGLKLNNPNRVVEDLKKAAQQGKIATMETFGEKSQQEILRAIELFGKRSSKTDRMPLPYAFVIAEDVMSYLKKHKDVKKVDALGSLRRMVSTIGDVDIAVQSKKNEKEIVEYFLKYPKIIKVDNRGDKKASIIVAPNIRIDLRIQDEKTYGSMLQYFTGGKAHNINLREYAIKKGYSLNEYGIKVVKKVSSSKKQDTNKVQIPNSNKQTELLEFDTEEKFYGFLGLQYIPPEIREGTNEIGLAETQKIPRLVETKDIKGDMHLHSSYDLKPSHDFGKNTYLEILKQAHTFGYEYVGFADHNPRMSELTEDQIVTIMKKRKEFIKKTCDIYQKVKYFIGLETDILPDGRIALPQKALEYVDYLVVSVHSAFRLGIETMTKRVLRALSYPKVKILGHPTGRLLGKREGYELYWDKIFEFCKQKNIAIEINSWPERLDLPDTLVRDGLKYELKYCIDTDAHAIEQMSSYFYGVSVARRGWCTKGDIINTLSYGDFKKWLVS